MNVTDLTDLGVISAEITVNYDANVLTATGVDVTGTIAEGSIAIPGIDHTNGTINIAMAKPTSFSGSGTLMFIIFNVDSNNLNDR